MANHQFNNKKEDEYYTKEYAIKPLLRFLPKDKIIWCPFDKMESNYVKIFNENGYKVCFSHIDLGQDFFNYQPDNWDIVVSNPPYSKRELVMEQLFGFKKPFAILINDAGLFDSLRRYSLLKNNPFEIMIFNKRIDYIKPNNPTMKGVPFKSIYLCSKLLPEKIFFQELDE